VPAADAGEPAAPALELELLLSSVPVTSTFLFASDASDDCDVPGSRMYVFPAMPDELVLPDPLVPAVLPAAPAVEPDELPEPIVAFVRMNDAPLPAPDAERDALGAAVVPPVEPDVPVAPAVSPDCRHPVTVIVPLCGDRLCDDAELV
jgi:hypothetical protein